MNLKGIILGLCFLTSFAFAMEEGFRTPPSSPHGNRRDIESRSRERDSIARDVADLTRQVEGLQAQGLDPEQFINASWQLMRRLDSLEPYANQYVDLARKVKKLGQAIIIAALAAQ